MIVVLPSDHRLASHDVIPPLDFAGETFIGMADQAPVLRSLIEGYFRRSGSTCTRCTGLNISRWPCRSSPQPAGWHCCPTLPAISSPGRSSADRSPERRLRSIWFWATIRPTPPPFLSFFSQGQTSWSPAYRGGSTDRAASRWLTGIEKLALHRTEPIPLPRSRSAMGREEPFPAKAEWPNGRIALFVATRQTVTPGS